MAIGDIVSLLANAAAAIGLPIIVYQLLVAARQRRKESHQSVWDLLAADDVYLARLHIQTHAAPADYATVMVSDRAWITHATKCFLAYQKAAQLVLDHNWMEPRVFAEQWGFSTLLVWEKLEPWVRWSRGTRGYPGFGRSLEALVRVIREFERNEPGFREAHFADPTRAAAPSLAAAAGLPRVTDPVDTAAPAPVQVHRVITAPSNDA